MSQPLPWSCARVVKASKTLNWSTKAVWLETLALASRGPCVMSASQVGRRLGLARVTVERARSELLAAELLGRRDRGPGQTAGWSPRLPPSCRPRGRRCSDDEMEACAERLDAHLKRLAPPGEPHSSMSEVVPRHGHLTHPMSELQARSSREAPPADQGEMSEPLTHGGVRFEHGEAVTDGEDGVDKDRSSIPEGDDLQHRDETPMDPADASRALDFRLEERAP